MRRRWLAIGSGFCAVLLSALGCSGKRDVAAAEAGPLAHFDASALHGDEDSSIPTGETTTTSERCRLAWPNEADEGFEVLVEASHVGLRAVISNVHVTTVQSDCALEVAVESPARYLEVGGVPDTRVTLRLGYVCPSGEGSAGITVSSREGVGFGGIGRCTPAS